MASTEEIRQRVAEIQAAREKAIEPLLGVLEERKRLQEQLAALDEPYGKAYVEAEAAGWRTEELEGIGADEPVRRPKTRTRKRSGSKKAAAGSAAAASEPSVPTAAIPAQESTGEAVAAAGHPST